ncbi:MAG: hypothetical protein QW815_07715 [Nitrososphaerota archaeon]
MRRRKALLEELLRIVQLCKEVEKRGVNPFEVDVKKALEKLRSYLPEWEGLEEYLLDVEALNDISTVIKLQESWARHRASTLYIDPLLLELKLKASSQDSLARAFIMSWHPIAHIDQLTSQRLRQGLDHWNRLPSLADRLKKVPSTAEVESKKLSLKDLVGLRALSKEDFERRLRLLEEELKRDGSNKEVDYWSFIHRDSFDETVLRAYLTSFLISEGRAFLRVDPLEESLYIEPNRVGKGSARSVALSLSYEDWLERKGQRRA